MKETMEYEEMCESCQQWYRQQHSGLAVEDYLIVCKHQSDHIKKEDLTSCRTLPENGEKWLVRRWKKDFLS